MSFRTLLATAAMVASTAPAFAGSGTIFENNAQGPVLLASSSEPSRSQAANEQRQQRGSEMPGGQGMMPDHPHQDGGRGSDKPMTHRGSNMPGGQGEMPDHPHQDGGRGSDKPMTHRGSNMPGGQGMMPDHPHQDRGR